VTDIRWAAVVVNYEAGPLLLECVRSVLADTSAGPVELVVVDNGSTDGSVAAVRDALPEVRIIRSPGNVGYARAANLGIAATHADVIAVLNPDLTVEPGTAAALVERLDRDPDLGAVGPRIRNPDASDYPSARRLPSVPVAVGHGALGLWWPTNPFTTRYRQLDADPSEARSVDWLSGAAVWLRRSALDAVGGWDERYFMYMEDVDLCWRLRRLGWRVAYEPGGRATHVQGASTARTPYRMIAEHHRSAFRFAERRWRGVRRLFLIPAACFLAVRAAVEICARALGSRPGRPRVSG
jgi:N-acetylglucosaminyl-diphospho-decaprenol L-rhamnosyltransferase